MPETTRNLPQISDEKAHEMMRLAIEEMKSSIQEERSDDSTSPKVGAVILFPDGSYVAAHRGELRDGDHAEYTLIERKLRDRKLDDTVLFATLEPCGPKARNAPKRGCAKRIVSARIPVVYVGKQDPHPRVAGNGLAYLRANGVDVRLFPRELQDEIEEEDAIFFEHARREAMKSEVVDEPDVEGSVLDSAPSNSTLGYLSEDALQFYRDKASVSPDVGTPEFIDHMKWAGFITDEEPPQPTGHGLLLFGKSPQARYPQSPLMARIDFPDDTTERKSFEGPLVLIPDAVEAWLRPKIPNLIDRNSMQRREEPAIPFDVLREAIINALVHRDYEIAGANIQLTITPDTVRVSSPGAPPSPLTLEQLQRFNAPMISRNPELHYAFVQVDLAEKMGFGLPTLRNRARELGLPLPTFEYDAPYLTLTIFRRPDAAVAALDPDTLNGLSPSERKGWIWLSQQEPISSSDYAEEMGVDTRTARRHLRRFIDLGLVEQEGATKGTRYRPKGT